MNQLTRNKGGYPFYTKLFPALMQGERTEASVIAALDRIYQHQDLFDVVVIIRGGGATSDLNTSILICWRRIALNSLYRYHGYRARTG